MKLYLDFLMSSLSDKDSAQGFGGLFLMFSSTFIADFSFVIGALTAIGGCILVVVNVMIKLKEYKRIKNIVERVEREERELENNNTDSSDNDESLT